MPKRGRYECPKRSCTGQLKYEGADPNDFKFRCKKCGKVVRFERDTPSFDPRNIEIPGL